MLEIGSLNLNLLKKNFSTMYAKTEMVLKDHGLKGHAINHLQAETDLLVLIREIRTNRPTHLRYCKKSKYLFARYEYEVSERKFSIIICAQPD